MSSIGLREKKQIADLLYRDETYKINGAAIEVHRELGAGFAEAVYQEALEMEFRMRNIPFEREMQLTIMYKGKQLKTSYRADFICYERIIVELKARKELDSSHTAQVLNYLKATNYRVGLLFNFGSKGKLERERIVF